jgi:hypothetical protein
MFARAISVAEIQAVINRSDIIAEYPGDKPYPTVMLLGFVMERPLHVLVARVNQRRADASW